LTAWATGLELAVLGLCFFAKLEYHESILHGKWLKNRLYFGSIGYIIRQGEKSAGTNPRKVDESGSLVEVNGLSIVWGHQAHKYLFSGF
jgi:hypothetical protein